MKYKVMKCGNLFLPLVPTMVFLLSKWIGGSPYKLLENIIEARIKIIGIYQKLLSSHELRIILVILNLNKE